MMLYKLLHCTGKVTNVGREKALELVASGKWYDNTNYSSEEIEHELRSILLQRESERKKPQYQRCEQRTNENVQGVSFGFSNKRKNGNKARCSKRNGIYEGKKNEKEKIIDNKETINATN